MSTTLRPPAVPASLPYAYPLPSPLPMCVCVQRAEGVREPRQAEEGPGPSTRLWPAITTPPTRQAGGEEHGGEGGCRQQCCCTGSCSDQELCPCTWPSATPLLLPVHSGGGLQPPPCTAAQALAPTCRGCTQPWRAYYTPTGGGCLSCGLLDAPRQGSVCRWRRGRGQCLPCPCHGHGPRGRGRGE